MERIEKQIISQFLTNKKLKFNEIEKLLNIRSNKLNYHLKLLINKKILEKDNNFYQLTESSEYLIPYVSEKNSLLPVVLIKVGNKSKVFLYKREKRPYNGLLGLPGGRILLGENIEDSVKRIMKEKHNINAKFEKINSLTIEHLKRKNKIINSFLLIFVTATPSKKEEITFTDIENNKRDIIKSDYSLLKKDNMNRMSIEINTINSFINSQNN